ncbi:hypothetical protein F5X99DRAFT_379247 [Biscogniauxia marginata]|nr:hypothetical protein F5X99DRAFT_379247 [Biscogniauxia marginata]
MSSPEKFGEGDLNDFSSYITIKNASDYDLGLIDYGINSKNGEWPPEQPLNTIEARETKRIHLKDRLGTGGSDGWVQFEVRMEHGTETFRLDFADPTGFSRNSLRATSSNDNVLSISVTGFNRTGHPLYGNVDVKVTRSDVVGAPADADWVRELDYIAEVSTRSDETFRAKYEIGFDAPGGSLFDKEPIHECIVIASLIQSQVYVPRGTTYHNLNSKQWEYVRGLVWNDDPSCLLFQDRSDSNHHYSDGTEWAWDFKRGEVDCMIQRSHFGDFQFLHAMGAKDGERPEATKQKLIKWLEVMYKLACGDQDVSDQDQLKKHFREYFTDQTTPSRDNTIRQLLLARTSHYPETDVQKRALGTCLHVISDSYAIGHTQRRLKNGSDYAGRDGNGYYRFKPGTYGTWGPIIAFHTYAGQNGDKHSHYDGLKKGEARPIPKDLNSFNSMIGARDAIGACTRLINYWAQKKAWDSDVRQFLETEVFALDDSPQPSNGRVDESDPVFAPDVTAPRVASDDDGDFDLEFHAGLQRKMASLEEGIYPSVGTQDRRSIWRSKTARSGFLMLFIFLAAIILTSVSM